MRICVFDQGTDGWLRDRLGCPSGSNFAKLITATGKPSTSAEGYINQLIAERLMNNMASEVKVTEWMQRGTELEPMAREFYEFASGNTVTEIGFCKHDTLECGVSPDGLVGDDGLLEIKCPAPSTHVSYLRKESLPSTYKQQVMGQLWISEREWCDFVSYHPDMKTLITRVYRDDEYISLLAAEVEKACNVIEIEYQKLRNEI